MVDITNVCSEWFGNQLYRKRKEALNLEASEMEQSSKQSLPVKKAHRNYSKAENFNALLKGMKDLIDTQCKKHNQLNSEIKVAIVLILGLFLTKNPC